MDNVRFFRLYETLKEQGRIKTYVQLADILETNKAGINDLKAGRKKVTIENWRSMINSYPDIDPQWVLTGEGPMFRSANSFSDAASISFSDQENGPVRQIKVEVLKEHIDALRTTASFMESQLEVI